jgi:predicted MFS family arabinose efflux permease
VHAVLYLTRVSTPEISRKDSAEVSAYGIRDFITNKRVIGFFLLITVPVIACGYFLNYLFPILGSEYGLSETKVGYAYMINGLCVICFSSILTEYFSKKIRKAHALVIASLLYAAAFLCVAVFQNIASLVIVLILLGLSDSFGFPLQTSYYTDLEAVQKYGYDKSIGIFSLVENVAQAGGSFVFSYVLLIGVREGLILVLCVVSLLAVLFGLIFRSTVRAV